MKKIISSISYIIISIFIFLFLTMEVSHYRYTLYFIEYTLLFFIIYAFFTFKKKDFVFDKYRLILSIIFGFIFVSGRSYFVNNCFLLHMSKTGLIITILQFIIMSILFYILSLTHRKFKLPNNPFVKILDHSFCLTFCILLITWIPYMIICYPCFIQIDSMLELAQYLKMPNQLTNDVTLLNANQLITSHHSILYTYLLGIFSKIININIGLFILNTLQTIFLIFCISKMLLFLKERTNKIVVSYLYLIICFFPFFPFMGTILEKDTLFMAVFILFAIELYKFLNKENYNLFIFIGTACLLLILRNNFKYVIFPFLIVLIIKEKKMLLMLICLLFTIIGYNGLCNYFSITPGSKAEAYSVPILQVSKCVIEYGDEFSNDEKEIIDNVLEYDKIEKLFNPKNADDLKQSYARRKPTDDEVKDFFKLWIKLGLKHPIAYIESFLNKNMGYFFQFNQSMITEFRGYGIRNDFMTNDTKHNWDHLKLDFSKFGFHPNKTIIRISKNVEDIIHTIFNLPIIGLLTLAPTYIWMMIITIAYLIKKRDSNNLLYMLFLLLYFGTILLSPVDGIYQFRYIYPIFVSSPIFYLMWEKNK